MADIELARAAMPVVVLAADEDGDKGHVEALVSAYNVKYRMGFASYHIIRPGAFAESIADQAAIPMFWMHNWDWTEQPPIGHGTASEVDKPKPGLKISGELYLDQPGVPAIFRAIKAKALRQWSIGYRPEESGEDPDDDMVKIITKAELLEASSVLRGANPGTETLKVASHADLSKLGKLDELLQAASKEIHRLFGVDITPPGRNALVPDGVIPLDEIRAAEIDEATAVPVHHTDTVEGTWDAGVHVGRLPSPMSVGTARRMYGWYDTARVEAGQIVKNACSLPHHEVSTAGVPGAANLNGVRNALSRLPGSNIPATDHAAIRSHLQAHLDDAPDDSSSLAPIELTKLDPELERRRTEFQKRQERLAAR